MPRFQVCVTLIDTTSRTGQRIVSWKEDGQDLFAVADKLREDGYDEVIGIVLDPDQGTPH